MEDKYNVKKTKTKSCKPLLQKKKNCYRNKKSNFCFTDKNDGIDLYSSGDQTNSKSDDWEHFPDFAYS